ncbi:hypothetical protein OG206_32160 [Streptomyces sp. NBC_01341]|nr:hypothetical protein OG206_32160 [Streptomyces sp. NBC_01341]
MTPDEPAPNRPTVPLVIAPTGELDVDSLPVLQAEIEADGVDRRK